MCTDLINNRPSEKRRVLLCKDITDNRPREQMSQVRREGMLLWKDLINNRPREQLSQVRREEMLLCKDLINKWDGMLLCKDLNNKPWEQLSQVRWEGYFFVYILLFTHNPWHLSLILDQVGLEVYASDIRNAHHIVSLRLNHSL